MITNHNTEPPAAVTIHNTAGPLVQTIEDVQETLSSSCLQVPPRSAAAHIVPVESPADMVKGNYTWPTVYGVDPRAEPDEFFNNLLSSALHGAVGDICKDEQIIEDLLSRVILGEGWSALFNRIGPVSCPLLAVLHYLDEAALQECRPIDRLALLYAIHSMYLV